MKNLKFILFSFCGLILISMTSSFACDTAKAPNDPGFCPSFKAVAYCHCTAAGVPGKKCEDMNYIYELARSRYGSIENACRKQTDTDYQTCMDSWGCYRGDIKKDSKNQLCSGTGNACEHK